MNYNVVKKFGSLEVWKLGGIKRRLLRNFISIDFIKNLVPYCPVLDLLHARGVSPTALRACRLNPLAIRISSVRKSASALVPSKAFTLSEVFIAMVVIAIVGTVCISFLKNRNDYSREYMYYSTYQNLVKVMDTIMDGPYDTVETLNDTYPNPIWLTSCNGAICMKLKTPNDNMNLCTLLKDKLNFASFTDEVKCEGKLANGIEFIHNVTGTVNNSQTTFTNSSYSTSSFDDVSARIGEDAYTIVVDIDGTGNGKDQAFYDIMPFYITQTGKVIPLWGAVAAFRGYKANTYDAAANPALMSFDVVYNYGGSNILKILSGGKSVSFPVAACLAGYVAGSYCTLGSYSKCKECGESSADCRVRLVKKLKWSR